MEGKIWCCQGVLKEDGPKYGIGPEAPSYTFLGRERVGGCMRTFLTRWELEKHLHELFNACHSSLGGKRMEGWTNAGIPTELLKS